MYLFSCTGSNQNNSLSGSRTTRQGDGNAKITNKGGWDSKQVVLGADPGTTPLWEKPTVLQSALWM